MGILEIIIIAVGLAMDAFAVSIAAGTTKYSEGKRATFRLSFHFGLFQFMMPVVGWYLGSTIAHHIAAFDHWVAFGLLLFVGVHMIYEAVKGEVERVRRDPSRGMTLIALCIATSIDALAVGMSLAMLDIAIWYPSVIIGVVTASLSLIGLRIGYRLSSRFGKRMEIVGGITLILIGIRILVM